MNHEILYVVCEKDRGCGISVVAVYSNESKALELVESGANFFILESYCNIIY